MSRQIINTGTAANDGTGDALRAAFTKSNENFAELYTANDAQSATTDALQTAVTAAASAAGAAQSAADAAQADATAAAAAITAEATARAAADDALAATKQPIDVDLTAIAALAPVNNDVVQRKLGAWTNRSIAQLQTDLDSLRLAGAVPTRIISFGDSLSLASSALGASTIANMYMRKVAAYLGLGTTDGNGAGAPNAGNFVESAISGINSQRYINALNRNLELVSTDIICGIPLFNTMRALAPDPAFLKEFPLSVEATLAWFALPESAKIRAILTGTTTPNPAVVTAGTWAYWAATVSTDLNGLALRGTTANATATFPAITGDTVYVWYLRSTLAEAFTVSVDGIAYNVGGAVSYNTWLDSVNDWELCLLRVSGLASGSHTVVATRTPGNVNIVAIAGFDSASIRATSPAVLITNCPPMIAGVASQGYAFSGSAANDPMASSLSGSATFDAASLADGEGTTTTVTVTGAALGDFVEVSFSVALVGITVTAWVSATNTVSVRFQNESGGAVDLASGTLRARVKPASGAGNVAVPYLYGHAGVHAYNKMLAGCVSRLQRDGLRIELIDLEPLLMPTNDVSTDFVHFNNTGNEKMFREFRRTLNRAFA